MSLLDPDSPWVQAGAFLLGGAQGGSILAGLQNMKAKQLEMDQKSSEASAQSQLYGGIDPLQSKASKDAFGKITWNAPTAPSGFGSQMNDDGSSTRMPIADLAQKASTDGSTGGALLGQDMTSQFNQPAWDAKRAGLLAQADPAHAMKLDQTRQLIKPIIDTLPQDQQSSAMAEALMNPDAFSQRRLDITMPAPTNEMNNLKQLQTAAASGDKDAQKILNMKTTDYEKQKIDIQRQQIAIENKRLGYERYQFGIDPMYGPYKFDKDTGQPVALDGTPLGSSGDRAFGKPIFNPGAQAPGAGPIVPAAQGSGPAAAAQTSSPVQSAITQQSDAQTPIPFSDWEQTTAAINKGAAARPNARDARSGVMAAPAKSDVPYWQTLLKVDPKAPQQTPIPQAPSAPTGLMDFNPGASPAKTPAPMGSTQLSGAPQGVIEKGGFSAAPVTQPASSNAQPLSTATSPRQAFMDAQGAPVLAPDVEQRLKTNISPYYQDTIRGMINGTLPPPSGRAQMDQNSQNLLRAAMSVDPSFSYERWLQKNEMAKKMADQNPTSAGGMRVAGQTMINHTTSFLKAMSEYDNGSDGGKLGGSIANWTTENMPTFNINGMELGPNQQQRSVLNSASQYGDNAATELEKLTTGGKPGEGSKKEAKSHFSTAGSIADSLGGAAAAVDIMRGKVAPQVKQYNEINGTNMSVDDWLGPEVAQKIKVIEALNNQVRTGHPVSVAQVRNALSQFEYSESPNGAGGSGYTATLVKK